MTTAAPRVPMGWPSAIYNILRVLAKMILIFMFLLMIDVGGNITNFYRAMMNQPVAVCAPK